MLDNTGTNIQRLELQLREMEDGIPSIRKDIGVDGPKRAVGPTYVSTIAKFNHHKIAARQKNFFSTQPSPTHRWPSLPAALQCILQLLNSSERAPAREEADFCNRFCH